jgi:hypothetical protein
LGWHRDQFDLGAGTPMKIRQKPWRTRWQSLRVKIIAWSFVPTVIILAIVAWATFHASQRLTEDLVIERDQELTRLIASELAREMGPYIKLLSANRSVELRIDGVARQFLLEQVGNIVKPRIGEGGNAYLVDDRGDVIYHSTILTSAALTTTPPRNRL